jgi:hypothetical protein
MNAVIALIGTIVLGYVWLLLYNYAAGFDDLFLLSSIAAASLHFHSPENGDVDA